MGIKAKILKELQKKPRRLKELKAKLGNDKKVARAVDELVERNKVVCRKGVYAVPDPKTGNAVECTLVKLAGKFGFARPVQPDGQDIFIPGKYLMGAMPGDTLLVSLFEHPRVEGSSEGEVLAVVKENNRFTGTVETIEGRLALVPDACPHCPIYIKKSADGGARDGEKAAVEILERGDSHEDHRAGVAMRFGSAEESKQCAKALLYGAGLSRHFPLKAKAEAKKYEGAAVGEKEAAGRRDYRGMPVFTIDSAETKDIDDAISLEKTDTGYRLGVHIADVSHYVRPGSALDAEAFARGTSVYYADSVIPMLPRQLSNGICSLNEGADRLAFSCMMELDAAGRVVDYAFVKSVIRSRVKGVYKEVNAIFDGTADNALRQRYAAVAQELPLMRELYHKLAKLRAARGAMDIESGEAKLVLDEAGRCVDVVKRERGEAEQMIEEFMLAANETVAAHMTKHHYPFIYRVHDVPDEDRMQSLSKIMAQFGTVLKIEGKMRPKVLQMALRKVKGKPEEGMISTLALRSMKQAVYQTENVGHFGLAAKDYTHFTSPIRRYPDLLVHRLLKEQRTGQKLSKKEKENLNDKLSLMASHASTRERLAIEAERETDELKMTEYMLPYVGQEFDGTISGVTSFGMFVQLENGIEGLVHISSLLDDYYRYDEEHFALVGEHGGKSYRLGSPVRIKVFHVSVEERKIDFILPEFETFVTARKETVPSDKKRTPKKQTVKKGGRNKLASQTQKRGGTRQKGSQHGKNKRQNHRRK